MEYREFGHTGWQVSTVSFGAWAIGADWGQVEKEDAIAALHTALDEGINLFDTADVYGDGRSELLCAGHDAYDRAALKVVRFTAPTR